MNDSGGLLATVTGEKRQTAIEEAIEARGRFSLSLKGEWAEAWSVIEEVNRVRGLALAVAGYHRPTRSYADLVDAILKDVEARRSPGETCLAYFPDPPPS